MAQCKERSAWYCWHHRSDDPVCMKCDLYEYKGRKSAVNVVDGKKVITCRYCGETLPVTEFYLCRKTKFDKFGNPIRYVSYIYRCRKCTLEAVKRSSEKKKKNG